MDWNQAYKEGLFKNWDYGSASSEIVTFFAVQGLPQKGKRALDIGCGGGWESIFLAECGFEVTGIDFSSNAIKLAQERANEAGIELDFRQGNALKLPVQDETIDFANDRGCLHVIPEEDRFKYALEIRRVLKPGGQLLLRGCRGITGELKKLLESSPELRKHETVIKPITVEVIDRLFPMEFFQRGPVLPLKLMGSESALPGNVVLITKR